MERMSREEHLALLSHARDMEAIVLATRAALKKGTKKKPKGVKVVPVVVSEEPAKLPYAKMLVEVTKLTSRVAAVATSLFRKKARLWFRR